MKSTNTSDEISEIPKCEQHNKYFNKACIYYCTANKVKNCMQNSELNVSGLTFDIDCDVNLNKTNEQTERRFYINLRELTFTEQDQITMCDMCKKIYLDHNVVKSLFRLEWLPVKRKNLTLNNKILWKQTQK